ncbi:MAG: hypothetical protein CMJ16_01935 [Peredibacter sp.]|nr:hypothetical protein [Peredibacter sp.]
MKNTIKSSLALVSLLIFVSCGGSKPMVEDVKVKPRLVDNELHVTMTADLGIGALTLPNVVLPITKDGDKIGHVRMISGIDAKNTLEVDLNVYSVRTAQPEVAALPNGDALPLIGQNDVIVVPVSGKVTVYISISDGHAALGVSVPFKTLDSVGQSVGQASLFPMFNMNNVIGAAGLYTSKTAGKNGFGLFADISSVLGDDLFGAVGLRGDIQAEQQLDYSSIAPSRSKERRINRELIKLNRRRAQLRMR